MRKSILAKAGELSRALGTLLSDSTPYAVTPTILQSLEEKHPPRPSVIPVSLIFSDAFKTSHELFDISPIAAHSLIQKSSREIAPIAAHSLIQKSSREIAPGVDNLRYEHLKQLAGRNASPAEMEIVRIIAEVLTRFANMQWVLNREMLMNPFFVEGLARILRHQLHHRPRSYMQKTSPQIAFLFLIIASPRNSTIYSALFHRMSLKRTSYIQLLSD